MKIFNTLTGKKDLLKPINGKKINMFVCGPTVYDFSHLGHARSYVIFDAFVKYLRKTGFKVYYLQNITDIDDKIIARAREKKVGPRELAEAFAKEYFKDMEAIKVDSVSKYAFATKYIKEIISQIKRLGEKGYAYKIEDDGIYYDISKFKNYGKLSGRTATGAEDAVSRIDYSKNKKNRGDFCLWKFKQQEEEPSWPSPFGEGRPGWHIEDTAITEKFFGPQYDIHGAARDLIFPHHEAEISQMEAISQKAPMAAYWMHAGFLTIKGQKMSKSLGNFIAINDFVKRYSPEQLRFFIVKNLWHSPIDYSESVMIEVKSALEKLEEFLRKIKDIKKQKPQNAEVSKAIELLKTNFYSELEDDFNTPKAFAVLFDFIKKANQFLDQEFFVKNNAKEIQKFFKEMNEIFGIINFEKNKKAIPAQVRKLVSERENFRKENNWKMSDQLRAQIEQLGFIVEDTKDGPIIKQK